VAGSFDKMSYSLVSSFDDDDYGESEIFHEYSKLNRTNVVRISRRVEEIKSDPGILAMMGRSWKEYPGADVVDLPAPQMPTTSYADVVLHRRSVSSLGRNFLGGEIGLGQLSGLLKLAYGATSRVQLPTGDVNHLRATCSAGALYPMELYVVALDVAGLPGGLYHFRPVEHRLEVVRTGDLRAELAATSSYPDLCTSSSAAIVITGVMKRTLSKYQHRGYRFALYDCGALTQSLYLAGTAMELETCALGGIYDDDVARFLGVNPVDEPVHLGFLVGPPAPEHAHG
jgi:SagB-type dehydrogenase family enzyme